MKSNPFLKSIDIPEQNIPEQELCYADKTGKPRRLNNHPNTRTKKYFLNKLRGMTKKDAAEAAGFANAAYNTVQIERTKTYQKIEQDYKKYLLNLDKIAKYHNKNIVQDKDKGARNYAIKMALDIYDVFPKKEAEIEIGDLKVTVRNKIGEKKDFIKMEPIEEVKELEGIKKLTSDEKSTTN